MLSFASNIKKVFVEFCSEDQWKLLQGESPEVEEKEKLKRIEGDSDGESNEGDEESSQSVQDNPEFDLHDLSLRYWAFLLLNLASCKTVVSILTFSSYLFFRTLSKLFLPLSPGNPCWPSSTLFLRLGIWDPLLQPKLFSLCVKEMMPCLVSFFFLLYSNFR